MAEWLDTVFKSFDFGILSPNKNKNYITDFLISFTSLLRFHVLRESSPGRPIQKSNILLAVNISYPSFLYFTFIYLCLSLSPPARMKLHEGKDFCPFCSQMNLLYLEQWLIENNNTNDCRFLVFVCVFVCFSHLAWQVMGQTFNR